MSSIFPFLRNLARLVIVFVLGSAVPIASGRADPAPINADQGPLWTNGARSQFYILDQGAQMIPFAWLQALRMPDGKPFLDGALARYGYLPNPNPSAQDLPVGFTLAASADGPMVGMTCAACHTRQISVSGQPYRIDGGPALADFQSFLADLDAATVKVITDAAAFKAFASSILGADADEAKVAILHADLTVWSVRFHTLISKSLPLERPWGPARLDAVSMILNRLTGLDLGPAPTYLIPDNIVQAYAPTRYPFLWNASRQDHTQWPGFAPNGNDLFALSRNLGEVYGVFGLFHPAKPTGSVTLFDRNYLVQNSANFAGLRSLEDLIKRIGPPVWQWPIDQALKARGKTIYDTWKTGPAVKSCAECHGIQRDLANVLNNTWKTPVQNVGTDLSEWNVLGRYAASGSLEGASIPLASLPILQRDFAISILKISVAGAVGEESASKVRRDLTLASAQGGQVLGGQILGGQIAGGGGLAPQGASLPGMQGEPNGIGAPGPVPSIVSSQTSTTSLPQLDSLIRLPGVRDVAATAGASEAPPKNAYEARVLQGIWAAAPYLHNGSVPTLADLLKPADQRPTTFPIGPAYDLSMVGLATNQSSGTFVLKTTGCDDLASGDSNCGHEYGTQLNDADKKALLEYLKAL